MSASENASSPARQAVVPHLTVKGAAEAIDFYVKAFGAEEMCRIPMPDGKLIHASISIAGSQVFLCDEFPAYPGSAAPDTLGGTPVSIHLNVDDVDASYAQAVAAGAEAAMPPADMFWGDRYGQVVDPFGHRWSMATPVESVGAAEIAERMKQFEEQPASA